MNLTFKIAQSADKEVLQNLWLQSHTVHYGPDYLTDLETYNKNFIKKHERQFDSFFEGKMEDGQICIAYKSENPVGYIWLSHCQHDPQIAQLTEIMGTEKGVGKPALKKIETMAKENGKTILALQAYEEQTAFYEKYGYEPQEGKAQRDGLVLYAKYLR